MNPLITTSYTKFGTLEFFNFLEIPFLTQNIDLGFDFDVFGKPLDNYFSLPLGTTHVPLLDYDKNTETAKFLATHLDNYRTSSSSWSLKRSEILVFLYTLAECQGHRFLFVTRFNTRFCEKTRKDWAFCLGLEEYDCCLRNYCQDFNLGDLNKVSDELLPDRKVLDKYCYFKKKHVDVTSLIWCYRLGDPPKKKNRQYCLVLE